MIGPQRRAGVDSRDVEGELVLWDGTSLHLLDSQAAAVWQLLDGEHTVAEVTLLLAKRFMVERSQLAADITRLVESFAELGLLAGDDQV